MNNLIYCIHFYTFFKNNNIIAVGRSIQRFVDNMWTTEQKPGLLLSQGNGLQASLRLTICLAPYIPFNPMA